MPAVNTQAKFEALMSAVNMRIITSWLNMRLIAPRR